MRSNTDYSRRQREPIDRSVIQKLDHGYFFGETLRSRRLSGLNFCESRYDSGLSLPRHLHKSAYFCFVLRGSYDEVCRGRLRPCRPSTLIFHDRQETHTDHFHSHAHLLSIELDPKWIEDLKDYSICLDRLGDFHGSVSSYIAIKMCDELRSDDAASAIALEGLTLELMAAALRHRPFDGVETPRRIELAKEYLDAHFSEPLRLSSLAMVIGAHPVYLARAFRRHYRCSVGEYVRRRRIEFACLQLTTSLEPLVKIALNAGFSDQASFSRTFKQFIGKTPTQFRSTVRG
jgi:AraC family transcriptional regulator